MATRSAPQRRLNNDERRQYEYKLALLQTYAAMIVKTKFYLIVGWSAIFISVRLPRGEIYARRFRIRVLNVH